MDCFGKPNAVSIYAIRYFTHILYLFSTAVGGTAANKVELEA